MTIFCRASALLMLLPSFVIGAEVDDLKAKADKGDAEATFQLGRHYADGKDVQKDEAEALRWYLKAAAKDHTKAEVQIGSFYAHGFGVKQDWAESIKWYRKAALKGDTTAQHNLGLDYLHGHGVEKDAEMAAVYFKHAADQGHVRAQFGLGELFEKGQGVKKEEELAYMFYVLASRHSEQVRIFGDAKAKEVIAKRDALEKKLSAEAVAEGKRMVAQFEAGVTVHPRRFGTPGGVGQTRGWYIWRKWDAEDKQAELQHEASGEIFKTRVLPWATTYRYLNYGCRPDALHAGERINAFFSPDKEHKRGFLVHFQDEIGQMKGHGHFWQIKSVAKDGKSFVAIGMAGDKPLDGKELTFQIDSKCRILKAGRASERFPFAAGDKVYLTWYLEKEERIAKLICDDASLDAIKKEEGERLAKEIDSEGMLGDVESLDGAKAHILLFATHWSQAGQLKAGQFVLLSTTNWSHRPEGDRIEARLTFRQNRGTYGSGVTDVVLELTNAADAKKLKEWANRLVRLIPKS